MRGKVGGLVALGSVLAVLAFVVPSGDAGARGGRISQCTAACSNMATVTYTGTLDNTVQLEQSGGQQIYEILTQDITWKASWTGPADMISDPSGQRVPWTSLTLSGSASIQYPLSDQGPGSLQNCAASLSAAPGQDFGAILRTEQDINLSFNTPQPVETPTEGSGCEMPARLACPPGMPPGEQLGSWCSPNLDWEFKGGGRTFDISSNYGPTDVGGKIVTSDLSSTVTVSGASCQLSTAADPIAARAGGAVGRVAAGKVDILAYQRDGRSVKKLENLSDKPYKGAFDAVVGQLLILGVDCAKPQKPAPGPYSWTVPGLSSNMKRTSAIASYSIDPSSTSLNQSVNTQSRTLTLEFIRSGTFKLKVQTGAGEGEVTVRVKVPDVVDKGRTYSFCAVNTANRSYTSPRRNRTTPPTLGAGLNDQCGDKPGIAWDWRVLLPKLERSVGRGTGAGEIAMAQLFAKKVEADDKVCVQVGNVNDPNGWPADDASFYGYRSGDWKADGGAGRSVRLADSDSPMIPLRTPSKTYRLVFRARDYLMYRSNVPGSAWVPISEQTWSFTGEAHFKLRPRKGSAKNFFGIWRLVNGTAVDPGGSFYGGVIAPLPQWTQAAVAAGLPRDC